MGVPRKTVELMTARDQTEENDDARVRPVLTSPRRPSTVMLDEQAAQGTLTLTTVATGAERRELDEARTVPHAGVVMTPPPRPSTEMLDEQAAQGTLTPTTVAAVAERRAFEEARTNPPEGCSSGREEETRASPTVSTPRGDSSFEAKCQCPVEEHGEGSDDDATLELGQEASDGDSECDEPYSLDLDIVFDAIGELAGEDGRDRVPVRQVQAQTSLSLGRLEDLLEEWECMGVICWDDTRSEVALCPSAAEALKDEY